MKIKHWHCSDFVYNLFGSERVYIQRAWNYLYKRHRILSRRWCVLVHDEKPKGSAILARAYCQSKIKGCNHIYNCELKGLFLMDDAKVSNTLVHISDNATTSIAIIKDALLRFHENI